MADARIRRVLVSGASGLIGSALVRRLREDDVEVRRLVRRRTSSPDEVNWAPSAGTMDFGVLDEVDAVINLSGASVGRLPWTPAYRRELVRSRVDATRTLVEAMAKARRPPRVLLNASAVGFYGDRPGERLTESSAAGTGFFPDLVTEWEASALLAPAKTRVVTFRTGVIVARGGAFAPVRQLTSLGLGTRFGTGGQFWPWISLEDEVRAIVHLLTSDLSGAVNLVGPQPATSDRVTSAYARRLHRPYLLRAPEFAIGALGEGGRRLLLDSMKVLPTRLQTDGFAWHHQTVEEAVGAALRD
jgi:uncharacterized protein